MAKGGLGIALMGKGDYPAALEAIQQVQRITAPSDQNLAPSSGAYTPGWEIPPRRGKILRQFQSEQRFVSPEGPCAFSTWRWRGCTDEGFRYAERSREQQESSLIFARLGLGWGPFRKDPRYFKLLTEIGLSDEQIQKNQHQLNEAFHR